MIRKRRDGLQVQVYTGRDPLTGRKRWVSEQVPGQTKAALRQTKRVEARLLDCQPAQRSASGRSGGAARCGRTGLDSRRLTTSARPAP